MNRSDSASTTSSRSNGQEHGNDIGWQALGPAVGCVLLSTTVVTARWIARKKFAQCEGLDDYVILVSLFLSWIMTALLACQVNGGRGVYAGPIDLLTISKLVIASNVLWILIVNITKASILIQYLRIFSSRIIRAACYTFLIVLFPAACWAIFGGVFLCTPIAKVWNKTIPGHCISAEKYWLSVSGTDICLDFLILLLPLPSISRLHLPRKQKQGLIIVFTLGFFVCIISLVRLLTVLLFAHGGNYTDSAIWAIVWSAVEANVGVVCASILSLKPLVVRLIPELMVETGVSKHCMRVALIREDGGSSGGKGKKCAGTPPSTETSQSGRSSSSATPMTSSFGSPRPLAEMEKIHVVQPDRCVLPTPRTGILSLFDMLQEDEDEARAHIQCQHRASSFIEHV